MVAIIAVVIVILLIRSGRLTPPERIRRAGRAVTKRVRHSGLFAVAEKTTKLHGHSNTAYDVSQNLGQSRLCCFIV